MNKAHALIVAGGIGSRMTQRSGGVNKVLLDIGNWPMISKAVSAFQKNDGISSITIVCQPADEQTIRQCLQSFRKVRAYVHGGIERQDSVYNGLRSLVPIAASSDIVVIHNAANPFVGQDAITGCIMQARSHGAAVAAIPAHDTIKLSNEEPEGPFVKNTLDRKNVYLAQTPQAMKFDIAIDSFESAFRDSFYGTDDVMLAERRGHKVKIVPCPNDNRKITTPEDLSWARDIHSCARIGIGTDSHKFSKDDKPLVLGNFTVSLTGGLEANSDGDVLLHALYNAIAQAIGEKSIGSVADDMCSSGIKDSSRYLKVILDSMQDKGFALQNIGLMIEAKKPKLDPISGHIIHKLSGLTGLPAEDIGITATSGEELTPFGRGEGIMAYAIVSLKRSGHGSPTKIPITANKMIIERSYAKINLTLDIISKHPNGYHEISSIMQKASLHDILSFEDSPDGMISIIGMDSISPKTNLIFKAASALKERSPTNKGARITVQKNIPMQAGLAGGSGNAASALRALNILWELKIDEPTLAEIASSLGKDIPFHLSSCSTAITSGYGDRITPLRPLPRIYLILIHPQFGISTKEAYKSIKPKGNSTPTEEMRKAIQKQDTNSIFNLLDNGFHDPMLKAYPILSQVHEMLIRHGAEKAMLSGSGSAMIGFFRSEEHQKTAYKSLKGRYPFISRAYTLP